MKDVSTAVVYVSPDGNDSNSGMTAAESVKTLQRAYNIGLTFPHASFIRIVMAGGTYTSQSNLVISSRRCLIDINGNVTIPFGIEIYDNSDLRIINSSYDFTLNGSLYTSGNCRLQIATKSWTQTGFFGVDFSSQAVIDCPSTFSMESTPTSYTTVGITNNSSAIFRSTLKVTAENIYNNIVSISGSRIIFNKEVTIESKNVQTVIHVEKSSIIANEMINIGTNENSTSFAQGLALMRGSKALLRNGLTVGDKCTAEALAIYHNSNCMITAGSLQLNGGANAIATLDIQMNSSFYMSGTGGVTIIGKSPTYIIEASSSTCCFWGSRTLRFKSTVGVMAVIRCTSNSCFELTGNTTCIITNDSDGALPVSTATVVSNCSSIVSISTAARFTGSNVTGQKYYADYGGQITVFGGAQNIIPGTGGTADPVSYGYYG